MELFTSYSGMEFLFLYIALLVTSMAAGVWIPAVMRPDGRRTSVSEMEEVAVLAGGADRHVGAVLSALFARDALDRAGKHMLRVVRQSVGETESEKSVLRKVGDFTIREARATLKVQAERIEARLIRNGLLLDSGDRWRLRLLSIVPYAVLFVIGLYRQQAGSALGEPTGLLIGLLIITAFFALIRLGTINPRTKGGNYALRDLEKQSSRLSRAPKPVDAGLAVAIFGTGVLVGTPWEPLHAVQRANGSGSDSGGSDGDSDGGDGGGGGCGGCGGCGG